MNYVDGFVIPVPSDALPAYRKLASKAAKIWREHGALEVHECVADDVMDPKNLPFDGKRMFWGGFKEIVSA
jgi:uncharacterized protein YbaA (DUF1428 family)